MDVLVVGGGPAGRALARACAAIGLETALVDPRPERPWPATYAAWADELPPGAPVAIVTARTRAVAVAEHRIERGYAVLDHEGLRLLPGVEVVRGHVVERTASTARLADGRLLVARHVVNATGGGGRTAQRAVGVVVPKEHAAPFVAEGEALLMDWRKPPHAGTPDPTFLYGIPLSADEVLLEETSLARRPGLPLAELRARLHARLAAHGIPVPDEEERVHIPLDGRPDRAAFGAAAGLVHPATGYSVAAALRLAPEAAEAIARGESLARALWPARTRAVHAFRSYGLTTLLAMRPEQVPEFFDIFFRLPEKQQRAYLSERADLRGLAGAMSRLFRTAGWRTRLGLTIPVLSANLVKTAG